MALDEAMVENYHKLKTPTLRLYTWRSPVLTIGYFQSMDEEIDREACQAARIPLIRRITGGRAVLHGTDLTYGLIAGAGSSIFSTPAGHPPCGIRESFLAVRRALVSALDRLGLKTDEAGGDAPASRNPLCFASSSRHEIRSGGRKLVGSAQRRWKDRLLQQGSILFEFDPTAFHNLFRFPDQEKRSEVIRESDLKVVGLDQAAGRSISCDEVIRALTEGFGDTLGIVLKREPLAAHEIERARQLMFEKYRKETWNRFRAVS
jgi:lipoate-protein ligase A